jgi:hypothetical protein
MIIAETCRQVLKDAGVNPDRMALEWASAAEAPRFVELITGYVSGIKSMGPLGTAEGESEEGIIRMHLKAGVKAASARKVRTALGKLAKDMNKSDDYNPQIISEGVAKKVLPTFRKERLTQEIQLCLAELGPCKSADLCEKTGGSKDEIDKILETLSKKELVKKKGPNQYEIGN